MSNEGKQTAIWSALTNPIFRSLWVANVVSGIGGTMHDTAAVWTMTTMTTSPTLVGLMQTMTALPLFLFALPAGALADIVNRRRQIIFAQVSSLAGAVVLAAVTWHGNLSAYLLLALTFLLGIGTAFTTPPWQALMPEIVRKEDISSAVTLGGIGVNVSRAIGPIIGGVLVAATGPAVVFLLNALSFVGVIFVLWRWKETSATRPQNPERMLGAMQAALRFTKHSPVVRAVLARNALFVLFAISIIAVLPLRVKELHLVATDFGILMGCYGVGGILSAFVVLPYLRRKMGLDAMLLMTAAVSTGAIITLGLVQNRAAMMIVLFIAGSSWLMSVSSFSVAGQNAYPRWVRARSSAVQLLVFQAALGIGGLIWGAVTSYSDTSTALLSAGAGLALTAMVSRFLSIGATEELDLTPSQHWSPHTLSTEPGPDDGPIMVALTYEVLPENEAKFREAMHQMRLIRLRDGAVRWLLSKSLDNDRLFRESFVVDSWGEHLRQHARATAADKKIEDAALAFTVQGAKVEHYLLVES